MRRLLTFAAFLLIVSLVPASAQRGGGGRGGFGGHGVAAGHPSAGHSFGGVHSGFGGGRFGGGGFRDGGFGGGRFRGRGFHHHCFGFGCGFGFGFGYPGWGNWGWGYYDPFLWDSASSYDYDEERDQQIALANQMNALSIQEQNLREREDRLQERQDQDWYARRPQAREEHAAPSPATVLVFRDQHKQEITNYAISSGTLWVLSDHLATKKIPLNELDLAATTKANDERGVEFEVPK